MKTHAGAAAIVFTLSIATPGLAFQSNLPPQQLGIIEGSVTDAGTGAVLGGVDLLLFKDVRRDTPLLVTTDASGHYKAEDLDPGRYRVIAQRNGYVTQKYGERARNRDGILVSVRRGQTVTDIDFRLFASAVITGRVLGDSNEPQPSATVVVLSLHYERAEQRFAIESVTQSNDRGEYRLFGLRPDRYYLAAFPPNRYGAVRLPKDVPDERYGISFYPNVLDAAKASTINVQPGAELNGADIVLMRYRTFHLTGRVIGVERGAQDPVVRLEPLISSAAIKVGVKEIAPDPRGVFDFSGVLPSQYLLSAAFQVRGTGFYSSQEVEVQDSDLGALALAPSSGIAVQGRIQVSDRNNLDVSAIAVEFHPAFTAGLGPPAGKIQPDGTFMTYVSAEKYNVDIGGLPQDSYVDSLRILDQDASDRVADFSRFSGSFARMEITLNPNGGRVEGIVENDKHESVSGAIVLLVPDIEHRKQFYLFRSATTDKAGHFTLRGIAPGEYKLLAWEDVETGAWEDPEFLKDFEDRSQPLTIKANSVESHNLQVIPAAVGQ